MTQCQYCGVSMCPNCERCHNRKCDVEYTPNSVCALKPIESATTQKAKGIAALVGMYGDYSLPPVRGLIKATISDEDIERVIKWVGGRVFVRPCPVRPRHGFVESRTVISAGGLGKVVKETLKADPEGELLLMHPIKATWSAVWTPSLVTFGAGHDGATGGKDTISFPLGGAVPVTLEECYESAGISPLVDDPYVEVVSKGAKTYLTQLRAGPKGGRGGDYIPSKVKVERVLYPGLFGDNLLAWEEAIKGAGPGTVVSHFGGSPIDHFSVHARCEGIPVVFSKSVSEGDELEPTKVVDPDPLAVLRGLVVAETMTLGVHQHPSTVLMMLGLHHSSAMEGEDAFWIGVGAGLLLRYGSVALRGEVRHLQGSKKPDRASVYSRALPFTYSRHRASVPRMITAFRYGKFGSSSVGGLKWAQCGYSIYRMFKAMRALALVPNQVSLSRFIQAYNTTLNQAHNNGWWMNKFTDKETFSRVCRGEVLSTVQAYRSIKEAYHADPGDVEGAINRWAQWSNQTLTPPKVKRASVTVGQYGMNVGVSSRLLGARHRDLRLDTSKVLRTLTRELGGDLVVVPSKTGLRVELTRSHMKPITLYEDEPLTSQDV